MSEGEQKEKKFGLGKGTIAGKGTGESKLGLRSGGLKPGGGLLGKKDDGLVKEDTKLSSLIGGKACAAIEQFKALHDVCQLYEKDKKTSEDEEEVTKILNQLEDDIYHTIKHTLPALAVEIDRGRAEIREYSGYFERANEIYTQASTSNKSNSTRLQYLKDSVTGLEQKAQSVSKAIEMFNKKLTDDGEQGIQALAQAVCSEADAIVNCSYSLKAIKDATDRTKTRYKEQWTFLGEKQKAEQLDDDTNKGESLTETLRTKFNQYEKTRKNDFEKRLTDPADLEKCKASNNQPKATGMGSRLGLGGRTLGTGRTFGSATKAKKEEEAKEKESQ